MVLDGNKEILHYVIIAINYNYYALKSYKALKIYNRKNKKIYKIKLLNLINPNNYRLLFNRT